MRDALDGRVALITGASRGIGVAIARRFAAEGARVALVARTAAAGDSHLAGSLAETVAAIEADGGRALPLAADLGDPATDRAALVARAEAELGPIDVIVHDAAACSYLPLGEVSQRRLRSAFEVNVVTPYLLVQAAAPGMAARGGGAVLNITSAIVAHPGPPPWPAPGMQALASTYAPSKAALDRLTTALAVELWPARISVNALAPEAAVRTEGATALLALPDEHCEPVEAMAEAALALVTGDPATDTGLVVRSRSFLAGRGRRVRTLDGREVLAGEPPPPMSGTGSG